MTGIHWSYNPERRACAPVRGSRGDSSEMPRIADPRFAPDCTIEVDGELVAARAGESIAAALVAAGRFLVGRSPKYHRPRGPFCLAGSCHGCIARVDGVPNQRTCRRPAAHGTVVSTQNAIPTARHDLLAAIDRAYPSHLDHHHLVTWNALANRATVAISRELAGTGVLPEQVPPRPPRPVEERFEVVVIGAGPAGLAAAEAAVGRGRRVLVVDAEPRAGGRLRCRLPFPGSPPVTWIDEVTSAVRGAAGELATSHDAVGVWPGSAGTLVALQREASPPALRLVRARAVVVATGSHALPPLVPRNDLPGIFAGRAVARLLAEDGIVPGRRCVVAGSGQEHSLITDVLFDAGVAFVTAREVVSVEGSVGVRRVALEDGERVACDALVWCGPRAATWDLARAAGVEVDGTIPTEWRLRADEHGTTSVPGLLVAGEVVRPMSIAEAIEAGHRAGEAAQRHAY
jgi:sarcosine oxidase subunit alpha